ncbi:Peptidase inhibitor family I36 [Streptomyces sp. DvalAA-14]|uniref:peptidase inhibitor family I36 protein n=1 Tax=unclassified Streptomyces TaxID=2593676 RepID=UPI00081B9294|nr:MULTISPECIES: peptidase inhibitor family I36 protein [unclassified Streptomyces]MYS20229.1 hypothetical protein [Streptomyces sp. SID4948]SCD63981.1 Peptidase inhibitor family I36 [Streptomyces sp. DvalAA-14]
MAFKKLAVTAALGVVALGGALVAPTTAGAASKDISDWNSSAACGPGSPFYFCLYYHTGATGGRFADSTDAEISDLTGYTFTGSDGDGQQVRNNAASAQNGSSLCNVGIWYSKNFSGNSNWLKPGKGGNFTSYLANNEASIAISDHTHCPNQGYDPYGH